MTLDNYIIHKSRVTEAWLAEFGDRLKLHFLPPYCPSESRIERLGFELHATFTRNHRQQNIDAPLDRVPAYGAERQDPRRRFLRVAGCRITEGHLAPGQGRFHTAGGHQSPRFRRRRSPVRPITVVDRVSGWLCPLLPLPFVAGFR